MFGRDVKSYSPVFFILSGLLLYLAEPPFGIAPLAFIALIPLILAATTSASYMRAALGGYLAGAVFFFPALFWLTGTTVAGYIALSLYCSLYIAIFAAIARRTSNPLVLAAAWTLLEFIRGSVAFTGFPWILLSHTQYNLTTFSQVLDVVGSYGLGGILVLLNVLLYKRQRKSLLVAAGIFAAILIYGAVRTQTITLQRAEHVAMVQASVPQEMKQALEATYDYKGVFTRYLETSLKLPGDQKVDLLVWPETVVLSPYTLNVEPSVLKKEYADGARFAQGALASLARLHNAYFLVGSTSYLPAEHGYVSSSEIANKIPDGNWSRQFNSAYLLDPMGRYLDRYDKTHLVPFGEYIPLRTIFPFLVDWVGFDASLSPGTRQTIFEIRNDSRVARFGVLICYEDTDSELARRLRRNGADFFINISNDAWFGLSELDQHFVAARYRAIENRVGVVRSGNNGISGLIDPLGRSEVLLDKNEIGSASGDLWITDSDSVYAHVGDWPSVIASILILAGGYAKTRSSRTVRSSSPAV
jgi:apolipoprotein N-acyltransferase